METSRKIVYTIILVFLLIFSYSFAIMKIEGLPFLDALYFSIITITTTGYGDYTPTTYEGRILTIIYLFFGIGIVMYLFGIIAQFIIEGEFKNLVRMRKMENRIKELKDHYIICGFGRIGRIVANKFKKEKIPFIVIDINKEILKEELNKDPNFNFIVGDARKDETLKKAKIEKAKGLITTLPTDADNVFITLSAKGLNPKIKVVAKADEEEAIKKLKRAGADKVVSPYMIGGLRLAEVALRPGILDFVSTFINIAKYEYGEDVELRKFIVEKGSEIDGKSLYESDIRKKVGLTILGIKKGDNLIINPPSDIIINAGDEIYAFGSGSQLKSLEKMVKNK
ncbi:potassium channel family protein [Methanotorris igneus]|uniref:TrkA-N domain protein n=1 Tax=Methanotorris igneus (strain DSM 5666 / JCM 11834 / Kol 5) TaxID=880724 RepID=F6BBR9_METIK|nr:potassium channel protein [Methanotorris igneus]AEF97199.1 TrkA-N domain protein [Methanotorris igneus Kol 5]